MTEPTGLLTQASQTDAAIARSSVLRSAIKLAAGGDAAAFESLVTVLQRNVHRWAMTYARDQDEAEEITQETFVLLYRNLGQYRGDSPVEGWVYGIVRRVGLAKTRKARRRRALAEEAFPEMEDVYNTDPGARVDRQRITEYVRLFFTELPPRQREVFDLVDLQGNEPSEVAALLRMNAATVRANLFKARASMRARILQDHPAWREVQS